MEKTKRACPHCGSTDTAPFVPWDKVLAGEREWPLEDVCLSCKQHFPFKFITIYTEAAT